MNLDSCVASGRAVARFAKSAALFARTRARTATAMGWVGGGDLYRCAAMFELSELSAHDVLSTTLNTRTHTHTKNAILHSPGGHNSSSPDAHARAYVRVCVKIYEHKQHSAARQRQHSAAIGTPRPTTVRENNDISTGPVIDG